MKFERIRREYTLEQLNESTLPADPMILFELWLKDASHSGNPDPTAMTLSTVNENGSPSSRMVLLKKVEASKLIFFTNYKSRKAKEIRKRQDVAANFYWPELERQIKVSGTARPLENSESDLYFNSRPFESKLSAWASPQSEVIPDREYLEQEYQKYLRKFEHTEQVPRPEHWGGFAIDPKRIEFWQGGKHRMHDRMVYTRVDGQWSRVRLAP